MSPKLRNLLVAAIVVVAWGIGFSMGGGFRTRDDSSAKSAGSNRDAATSDEDARRRVGRVMEAGPDSADESRRHVPWDREGFKNAAALLSKEGSIFTYTRGAMRMTDALTLADFPMVMEVQAELKGGANGELIDALELLLVGRWAELDPKAAAEFLIANEKLGGYMDFTGTVLWGVWAGKDPVAAATFAKSIAGRANEKQALMNIMGALARADVDNALAFARIHAPEMIGAMSSVVSQRSEIADPGRAARRLESLGSFDDSTTSAMSNAASEWAKHDHTAAREWALSLPDANGRSKALSGFYHGWLEADKKAATAALLVEPRTGVDLTATVEQCAIMWDNADWRGAAEWIKKLPVEKEQTTAAAKRVGELAREDAATGAEFLKALPDGAVRDAAIFEYVARATDAEPQARMEWALSCSDPATRKQAAKNVVQLWFSNDPAAAFEWLESGSGMTVEERAAFLRD